MKYSIAVLFAFFSLQWSFAQTIDFSKAVDDNHWSFAFDSSSSVNGPVYAIAVGTDGVYVGGSFTKAGSIAASNIARWDGTQWHALGGGVSSGGIAPVVRAIAISDTNVYVGGLFYSAGAEVVSNIARWDGSAWYSLGSGAQDMVRALTIDVNGKLYAGGDFDAIGGLTQCGYIANWDGSQWNAVDSGVSGFGNLTRVNTLVANGKNIYVGGNFLKAGSDSSKYIAMWNDSIWKSCGAGTTGEVNVLAMQGTSLYVAGDFLIAGGTTVNHIATYTSGVWAAIGDGVDDAPMAMDYGQYDVYVGSNKSLLPAQNVCKFDCCWDPMGSGVDGQLYAIAANGADVWVGGSFAQAGAHPSYYFGRWNPNIIFASIHELSSTSDYNLYPNPSNGTISLTFSASANENLKCSVFNQMGACVFEESILTMSGTNNLKLDLQYQASGVYQVQLSRDRILYQNKIVLLND